MLWGRKQVGWLIYLEWSGKAPLRFAAFGTKGSEGEGTLNPGKVGKVAPQGVCRVWGSLEEARAARSRVSKGKQGGIDAGRRCRLESRQRRARNLLFIQVSDTIGDSILKSPL